MIEKKMITPIGITSASNSTSMKGLPVISKAGVPGFEYTTWYGIFSTIGTPQPVIEKINAALVKTGADKAFRDRLEAQGVDLNISSPKELADLTRKETGQWEKIIREAKIELN
jgi:tripartite-type tricarboxylate transporter receptor subunit TctC